MDDFFALDSHVYAASFLNAAFLLIQLVRILVTKSVQGLSLIMFVGFLYMQIVYAIFGYKQDQQGLMWGMVASAIISAIIISQIFWRRLEAFAK
jgi:hypothetical protein